MLGPYRSYVYYLGKIKIIIFLSESEEKYPVWNNDKAPLGITA